MQYPRTRAKRELWEDFWEVVMLRLCLGDALALLKPWKEGRRVGIEGGGMQWEECQEERVKRCEYTSLGLHVGRSF